MLHQVEAVRSGERLVAVGWIQSVIRDPQQRELLFELETACQALAVKLGRCDELDLLYKCHANLLRRWGG
jgi:PKHD-type hydroxylase